MQINLIAKILITNSANLILVMRRDPNDPKRPGSWDLPGGGVEFGEDPTATVIREAQEEAGLNLVGPQIFDTYADADDGEYKVRLVYKTTMDIETVTLSPEHVEYQWVTPQAFADLDIPTHYKRALEKLVAGQA